MKPMRDEDGRIVRDGYSTRDGYQDDPGKPDEDEFAGADENGVLVREGSAQIHRARTQDDDPGKPDDEEVIDVEDPRPMRLTSDNALPLAVNRPPLPDGEKVSDAVTPQVTFTREAFEGLLRFAERASGTVEIMSPSGGRAWTVTVSWRGSFGTQRIYAEDASFDGACVLCRGLLAHALASGVATP